MTLLKQIRDSVNSGFVVGSERFKQEIEQLTGWSVLALKSGPKLKVQ